MGFKRIIEMIAMSAHFNNQLTEFDIFTSWVCRYTVVFLANTKAFYLIKGVATF
jgi:hypothetical protein